MNPKPTDLLKVAVAQMAPVWLNREATLAKILDFASQAADAEAKLLVFSEALLPGYPFWIEITEGAQFNSQLQKEIHAHYLDQALQPEAGHLKPLCDLSAQRELSIYLGCVERAADRGGHSLYASLVYIDAKGQVGSVHRKLMPTYEERLTWSPGDGHGLRTHKLDPFTVGGLNCWENWMPLPRAALYGMGEDLHVAVWPGSVHNTEDITRHMAKEGRSFVISASSVLRKSDVPEATPHYERIMEKTPDMVTNGGSCIASPDGRWLVEPVVGEEKLIVADLDHARVREERQNFDPVGHYSRPDVTRLIVNRKRQSTVKILDSDQE